MNYLPGLVSNCHPQTVILQIFDFQVTRIIDMSLFISLHILAGKMEWGKIRMRVMKMTLRSFEWWLF
jgi:hypothetical protein